MHVHWSREDAARRAVVELGGQRMHASAELCAARGLYVPTSHSICEPAVHLECGWMGVWVCGCLCMYVCMRVHVCLWMYMDG